MTMAKVKQFSNSLWIEFTNMSLAPELTEKLINLSNALVNQKAAKIIVPAYDESTGFWFGGGNMLQATNGDLYVVGRYRNFGDSRTGTAAGTRGLELAVFKSTDSGQSFEKAVSWSKADLNQGDRTVLSIEGSALRWTDAGVELYVSTEKDGVGYPVGFEDYLKPGTGVWTIDRLSAKSVEDLKGAAVEPFLECDDPAFIHVKDPFVFAPQNFHTDDAAVFFCSHPFCWSSSNTGFVPASKVEEPAYEFFSRGPAWDVAMTRGTAILDVPMFGEFADLDVSLMFYDGGECVRNLDEHKSAVSRPRGYSCEELGGVAYFVDGDLGDLERLSKYAPMFVSPYGTGCSRYVDVLTTNEGLYATWQQSQENLSQPLVMNFLPMDEVARILT